VQGKEVALPPTSVILQGVFPNHKVYTKVIHHRKATEVGEKNNYEKTKKHQSI